MTLESVVAKVIRAESDAESNRTSVEGVNHKKTTREKYSIIKFRKDTVEPDLSSLIFHLWV